MRQAAVMQDESAYNTGYNNGADLPVGEILRRTRLYYNQSLLDIERALRIKGSQIDAIERGLYDRLPGRVYVVGFVRSYAEYLGLDGEKMVGLLKMQSVPEAMRPELHFPVPASESRIPNVKIVAASLALVVVLIGAWWMMTGSDRSMIEDIPPVPASAKHHPGSAALDPAGPPVPSDLGKEKPLAAEKRAGVILSIVRNSWVEIKDKDGKAIVSRVLKAGDKYFVPDSPGLTMSLGNSGGVEIEINGQPVGALGVQGEVLRNMPLQADALRRKAVKSVKPVAKTPE